METRNPLRIFAILVVERQVPDWSRRSERKRPFMAVWQVV